MTKAKNKHSISVNAYNKRSTVQFCIRLNKNTDADIIEHLKNENNKQGYIKFLIRKDINAT